MKIGPKKAEQPQFLSGWKEIANYLGKGVRTVQRYERHAGLPVRRPAGKSAGSVVATRAELDAWVLASPIRSEFQLNRESSDHWRDTTAGIRHGLAQMTILRHQMTALRVELRTSLDLLRQSLYGLQGELNKHRWRPQDQAIAMLDGKQRRSYVVELRDMDPRRKAS